VWPHRYGHREPLLYFQTALAGHLFLELSIVSTSCLFYKPSAD
jgi:hypothetical protein